jgi:hypothetical protein
MLICMIVQCDRCKEIINARLQEYYIHEDEDLCKHCHFEDNTKEVKGEEEICHYTKLEQEPKQ